MVEDDLDKPPWPTEEGCLWCEVKNYLYWGAWDRLKCECGKWLWTHGLGHPHSRRDQDRRGHPVTCAGFRMAATSNNDRLLSLLKAAVEEDPVTL